MSFLFRFRLCFTLVLCSLLPAVRLRAASLQDADLPASGVLRAANPLDQQLRSAVWLDSAGRHGPEMVAAFSTDGGAYWSTEALALPTQCDKIELQSLTIDLKGRTHLLAIASGATDEDGGLYVYSTEDDGKTFRDPRRLYANSNNGVASEPVLVINVDPQDHNYQNHVYVAWVALSRNGTPYSEILVALSFNGGWTFTYPPVRVDTGNNKNVSAPSISLGNQGLVTVSWSESGNGTQSYQAYEGGIIFRADQLRKLLNSGHGHNH
jgi:hypothetical protein